MIDVASEIPGAVIYNMSQMPVEAERTGAIVEDVIIENAIRTRNADDSRTIASCTSERRRQQAHTSFWKDLLAGGIAGTAGIAIGHPLDTIKVRLQQQQQPSNSKIPTDTSRRRTATAAVTNTVNVQPSTYRGLYRGIGAPLATAALVNASVFCTYGATSRLYDNHYPAIAKTETSTAMTATTITKHAVCGCVTGLITSLLLGPVEHVKIRLQTMQLQQKATPTSGSPFNSKSNSSLHLVKKILRSDHGLRGLYRGLFATILRQTPSLAVYFPVYHILKDSIVDYSHYGNKTNSMDNYNSNEESPWWSSVLAGGLAGCLSWTIVYPIDAVKSRIQALPMDATAKERSFQYIARNISRNEGFARLIFSRGLAVTLLRAFLVNGTVFSVYEFVNQQLVLANSMYGNDDEELIGHGYELAVDGSQLNTRMRRRMTYAGG